MLNLIVGKTYKFTFFNSNKEQIARVVTKTIHAEKSHCYFVIWPNSNSIHDFGKYIWDCGYANSSKDFTFSMDIIKTCEEVVEENKVFDYEIVDSNKETIHTTINGKGSVARLKEDRIKFTSKKINKDTINIKDKWLY